MIAGLFLWKPAIAAGNEDQNQASSVKEEPAPLKKNASSQFRLDLNHLPGNLDKEFLEGGIDISKQAPQIVDSLRETVSSWPEEEQEEAEENIKLIDYNLKQYLKLIQSPPSPSQHLSLQKNAYSLPEMIELCHQKKQCNHCLCDLQDSLTYKEKKYGHIESLLGQTRKEYFQTEENSLQRAVLGLKIVSYWTYLVELNEEKHQLSKQQAQEEHAATSIDDSLAYAFDHLEVNPEDVLELNNQIQEAKDNWHKAHLNLETKQQHKLKKRLGTTEEKKHSTQELLQTELQEVSTHLSLISLEIQQAISDLLQPSKQTNLKELKRDIHEWKGVIADFDENVKKWTKGTLSQLQEAVEAFSVLEDEIEDKQKQILSKIASITQNNQIALIQLASEIDNSKFVLSLLDRKVASLTGNLESFPYILNDAFHWIVGKVTATLFVYNGVAITLWDITEFLLIIFIALWISRAILAGLTKIAQHRVGIRKSFIYRIHHLIHYAILTLGFVIGLSVIGFDLSNLLLIAGALGVGIGFGLQTIVNNFISGIIILFESKLRIGDYIEIDSGEKGEILEINFRSTVIRTNDGTDIILPNSHLLSDKVINWTLNDPFRRIHVPFSVAYGSDKDMVKKVVAEAAKALPYTLKEPAKSDPCVLMTKLGDNGLEFELLVWVDARASIRTKHTLSDYLLAIDTVLANNNLEVPFPQVDLRLKQGVGSAVLS